MSTSITMRTISLLLLISSLFVSIPLVSADDVQEITLLNTDFIEESNQWYKIGDIWLLYEDYPDNYIYTTASGRVDEKYIFQNVSDTSSKNLVSVKIYFVFRVDAEETTAGIKFDIWNGSEYVDSIEYTYGYYDSGWEHKNSTISEIDTWEEVNNLAVKITSTGSSGATRYVDRIYVVVQYTIIHTWHDVEVWKINLITRSWNNIETWKISVGTKFWNDVETWLISVGTKLWNNVETWKLNLKTKVWYNIEVWKLNLKTGVWYDVEEWLLKPFLTLEGYNISLLRLTLFFMGLLLTGFGGVGVVKKHDSLDVVMFWLFTIFIGIGLLIAVGAMGVGA